MSKMCARTGRWLWQEKARGAGWICCSTCVQMATMASYLWNHTWPLQGSIRALVALNSSVVLRKRYKSCCTQWIGRTNKACVLVIAVALMDTVHQCHSYYQHIRRVYPST